MSFEILSKLDFFFKKFNPASIWFSIYDIYFSFFLRFDFISFPPFVLNIYTIWVKFVEYIDYVFLPISFMLSEYSLSAIFFSIKFLIFIALLIFIRGGIPRYRFDYLTKLGWMKFLSLILLFFLFEFLLLISF